jgi:effector-binding domain-containing protein
VASKLRPRSKAARLCACIETPSGRAATAAHFGSYDLLSEAHAAVREWCAAKGEALAGPNWEAYGHWDDDPARVRTDVFYLLTETR